MILFYPVRNIQDLENILQQMLGKGRSDLYTQFVGLQAGATTVEIIVDNFQKS